jgi:hypothetical protein
MPNPGPNVLHGEKLVSRNAEVVEAVKANPGVKLIEIGQMFGISNQRVSQIINRAGIRRIQPGRKNIQATKYLQCEICSFFYEQGDYEAHCEEAQHDPEPVSNGHRPHTRGKIDWKEIGAYLNEHPEVTTTAMAKELGVSRGGLFKGVMHSGVYARRKAKHARRWKIKPPINVGA